MTKIFVNPLSSARLMLRRLQRGDADAISQYRGLPEVAQYQSWDSFGREDALRLIDEQQGREPGVAGTWFQLAIVEKESEQVVGDSGLYCQEDDPRQMEIGITLAPSHQGRGYATEALDCLLEYVFGTLAKHRVIAVVDAENFAAAALFRRLGFRQEAHHVEHRWFKGRWDSEFVFALLQREFKAGNCRRE